MSFEIIASAIVGLVQGVIGALAKTGVDPSEISKGIDHAITQISELNIEEESQKAKEWDIVTSASDQS